MSSSAVVAAVVVVTNKYEHVGSNVTLKYAQV